MADTDADTVSETDEETVVPAPAAPASLDATRVPEPAWLDEVEGEIDDVDLVLKCLARDSSKICKTCADATEAGTLDQRPVLARCASTKTAS